MACGVALGLVSSAPAPGGVRAKACDQLLASGVGVRVGLLVLSSRDLAPVRLVSGD